MAELVRRQDLPPQGGYKSIPYIRQPAKSYFRGTTLFAAFFGISAGSYLIYLQTKKQIQKERIEMRSSTLAMYPLLLAERDREFLKTLRRNRDEEAKLMANVEGWKVGTWFGEPIYKTFGSNELVNPIFDEYYVHTSPEDTSYMADFRHWS